MKKLFFKKDILKQSFQKAFKKLSLSILLNTVPFNRQIYQKQKGAGTSDQSLIRLQHKFRKLPLLVIYHLKKSCNVIQNGFQVIPKVILANLWKPVHDIMNYSTSICPFKSGKCGKEGKYCKKLNILRTKRAF